jgi:hypothetical protein
LWGGPGGWFFQKESPLVAEGNLLKRKKVPGQDGTMNGQTQGLPLRELGHHFPDSSHVKITLLEKIFSLLQKKLSLLQK